MKGPTSSRSKIVRIAPLYSVVTSFTPASRCRQVDHRLHFLGVEHDAVSVNNMFQVRSPNALTGFE